MRPTSSQIRRNQTSIDSSRDKLLRSRARSGHAQRKVHRNDNYSSENEGRGDSPVPISASVYIRSVILLMSYANYSAATSEIIDSESHYFKAAGVVATHKTSKESKSKYKCKFYNLVNINCQLSGSKLRRRARSGQSETYRYRKRYAECIHFEAHRFRACQ